MLVNCNSCQKKFTVPDSAITEAGRLLQCGSCGNKWTQYPIKIDFSKEEKVKKETQKTTLAKLKQVPIAKKIKATNKKKKREILLYSEEYLRKKHGLEIKDNLDNKKNVKSSNSSNFFGQLTITIIFLLAFFGILNLTRDLIVVNYPMTEIYIDSLYEVFNILLTTTANLLS